MNTRPHIYAAVPTSVSVLLISYTPGIIICLSSTKYSTSTLNNIVVSRYATQGKCPLGKLTHWYGFVDSLMPRPHWNRFHWWVLLLCHKTMAVRCFIWCLGLQMWVSEWAIWLKKSMFSHLNMFSCVQWNI